VVQLTVRDDGPGIARDSADHLFDRFYRGADSSSSGSGLGLAIAAELIRAHGGDIHLVEGTIGATFRISIPDRPVELQSLRDERASA
jgi:signal transduction histidine kinase